MDDTNQPHLKIKKEEAQSVIKYLKKTFKESSVLAKKFTVLQQQDYVLFPLNFNLPNYNGIKNRLIRDLNAEIVWIKPSENQNYQPRSLEEVLESKLPAPLMELIPKSYDIIGNIAIVELNQFDGIKNQEKIKKGIAKAIITVNHNIKTIYEKGSEIEGKYRLRELTFLAGEKNSITIHKENNCKFKLDIRKTFFSPRLNYERQRISNADFKQAESIVDMFAGVGPFSIQIARKNDVKIYAFDINKNAIKYLKENISLNKLEGSINPINKNVKTLINQTNNLGKGLKNKIDRILMNLPQTSLNYIDVVSHLAKWEGCILHNYQFSTKPNPVQKSIHKLEKRLKGFEFKLENVMNARIVKSYSPKEDMVGIDALIKRLNSD